MNNHTEHKAQGLEMYISLIENKSIATNIAVNPNGLLVYLDTPKEVFKREKDFIYFDTYLSLPLPIQEGYWYKRIQGDRIYRQDERVQESPSKLKIVNTSDVLLITKHEVEVVLDANNYVRTTKHIPDIPKQVLKSITRQLEFQKHVVNQLVFSKFFEITGLVVIRNKEILSITLNL